MLKRKGFTFIEIMIVIVIIAIMATVMGISMSAFNAKIKAAPFSHYLKRTFELIEERAILEQNEFGICVHKQGIQLYRYNQVRSFWQLIRDSTDLKSIVFPDTLSFELNIDNQKINLTDKCVKPNILFNDGGFITPFELIIKEKSNTLVLTGEYGGGFYVKQKS